MDPNPDMSWRRGEKTWGDASSWEHLKDFQVFQLKVLLSGRHQYFPSPPFALAVQPREKLVQRSSLTKHQHWGAASLL